VRILFDQGTPVPLKFDVLVTTDRNLRFQQNPAARKLAIVVLPTTSWPRLRLAAARIAEFVAAAPPGQISEFPLA